MKRLTGAIDKTGKFVVGKLSEDYYHKGLSEEQRQQQRLTHSAELLQPYNQDGSKNEAYSRIYHEQAISQKLIDKDPEPDFGNFI